MHFDLVNMLDKQLDQFQTLRECGVITETSKFHFDHSHKLTALVIVSATSPNVMEVAHTLEVAITNHFHVAETYYVGGELYEQNAVAGSIGTQRTTFPVYLLAHQSRKLKLPEAKKRSRNPWRRTTLQVKVVDLPIQPTKAQEDPINSKYHFFQIPQSFWEHFLHLFADKRATCIGLESCVWRTCVCLYQTWHVCLPYASHQ